MKAYVLCAVAGFILVIPSLVAQTSGTAPTPIPEEARRHFVMGETMFKEAKNVDAFTQAVAEFTEAARLAPQWPDARYNLALAKEAAGDYSGAMADLKLYQQFKLSDSDARTVQDKIYAIEAKQKMAVDAANSPAAQWEKLAKSLDGGVWMAPFLTLPEATRLAHERRIFEIHNGQLIKMVAYWPDGQAEPAPSQYTEIERFALTGMRLTYTSKDLDPNCNPETEEISDSGDTITESYSCYGKAITIQYVRNR